MVFQTFDCCLKTMPASWGSFERHWNKSVAMGHRMWSHLRDRWWINAVWWLPWTLWHGWVATTSYRNSNRWWGNERFTSSRTHRARASNVVCKGQQHLCRLFLTVFAHAGHLPHSKRPQSAEATHPLVILFHHLYIRGRPDELGTKVVACCFELRSKGNVPSTIVDCNANATSASSWAHHFL